ncbi:hypothetical protein ALC53_04183 [Atta colombica]|uniref:Uncharacterized protein n=1 Tax=Atta colombica TaxID=520822 RepID=A0A195BMG0_9HYME|nr:hypothetical protein ALC53_04183 [Atta colombica]
MRTVFDWRRRLDNARLMERHWLFVRKKKAGQPGMAERAGKVAVQNRTEGTLPVAYTSTGG